MSLSSIHKSLETFMESLDEGCDVCNWLFCQLLKDAPELVLGTPNSALMRKVLEDPRPKSRLLQHWMLETKVTSPPRENHGWITLELTHKQSTRSGQNAKYVYPLLSLKSFAPDAESRFWPPATTSDTTGSDDTFSQIKRWLRICNETHSLCRSRRSRMGWYPTRLVELCGGSSQNMECRIVRGEDIPKALEYITLSHRWGTKKDIPKLTMENIELWMKELPMDKLSRTFCDALEIARRLGVSYIWIDSLCIIQDGDDGVDWTAEAPTMQEVYSNAVANICASWAEDQDGIFSKRSPLSHPRIQISSADGVSKEYLLARDLPMTSWENKVLRSPLSRRGWVFQEQLLSLRNLHFCRDEVLFECFEMNSTETLGTIQDYPGNWIPLMSKKSLPHPRESSDAREIQYLWSDIVQEYSKRELTFPTDRLVAISGVAQQFKAIWGQGLFVAGLWMSRLAMEMLWEASGPKEQDNFADVFSMKMSFSWVSFKHGVKTRVCPDLHAALVEVQCVHFRQRITETEGRPFSGDIFTLPPELPIEIKVVGFLKRMNLKKRGISLHVLPWPHGSISDDGLAGPYKFRGPANLDFDINDSWLSDRNGAATLFYVPWIREKHSLTNLLLELVDGGMARFRRIGIHRPLRTSPYLAPQKNDRELPCLNFDRESRKHTFFIV